MQRQCLRCGYGWVQRAASTPRQCPYCKSPKWALALTATKRDPLEAAGEKIAAVARGPIALTTAAALPTGERHYELEEQQ